MNLHEKRLDIRNRLFASQMLQSLLEPLRDLFLFRRDSMHDLQISIYALDLPLKLAFFSNVKERYDEVAEAVVDVGMC